MTMGLDEWIAVPWLKLPSMAAHERTEVPPGWRITSTDWTAAITVSRAGLERARVPRYGARMQAHRIADELQAALDALGVDDDRER